MAITATDANIDAVIALLQVKVDALTDALSKARANMWLDRYKESEYAYKNWNNRELTQATLSGFTRSYKSRNDAKAARQDALAELESLIGGFSASATYVNMGGAQY